MQVANHLYCGAKVVGGHQEALTFLEKNKDDFNIRKIKRNAFLLLRTSVVKPRAEEPKLNCLLEPEPKLRIALILICNSAESEPEPKEIISAPQHFLLRSSYF